MGRPLLLTCDDFKERYGHVMPCCEICHACHMTLATDPFGRVWELCCFLATRAYTRHRFAPVVLDERDSQKWKTMV